MDSATDPLRVEPNEDLTAVLVETIRTLRGEHTERFSVEEIVDRLKRSGLTTPSAIVSASSAQWETVDLPWGLFTEMKMAFETGCASSSEDSTKNIPRPELEKLAKVGSEWCDSIIR